YDNSIISPSPCTARYRSVALRTRDKRHRALLIFYNTEFDNLPEMESCRKDADLMEKTFREKFSGNFRISRFENKNLSKITSILNNLKSDSTLIPTDSMLMCYFSSHGSREGLVTKNGEILPYDEIYKHLRNDELLCMNGKPKLVMLDCCRGTKNHVFQQKLAGAGLHSKKIHSDMAILKASPEGYTTFAFEKQPSVFTKAFCGAISNSITLDYTDIVHETTAKIKQSKFSKQCVPESTSYLDARLIFKTSDT
ncbi:CASP4-like protein, partial [Mya arenaria]